MPKQPELNRENPTSALDAFIQGPKKAPGVSTIARMSILTKQNTKDDLRKIAWTQRRKLNELVNVICREYIETHQADIDEYNRLNKPKK